MAEKKLTLGKYEIVQTADGQMYATRYEEFWRDLTGDHLVALLMDKALDADWQKRALDAGMDYVRETDDHYLNATVEQMKSLLREVTGVDVHVVQAKKDDDDTLEAIFGVFDEEPQWKVGRFLSSSNPSRVVLGLSIGAEMIERDEKHHSFIEWAHSHPAPAEATVTIDGRKYPRETIRTALLGLAADLIKESPHD